MIYLGHINIYKTPNKTVLRIISYLGILTERRIIWSDICDFSNSINSSVRHLGAWNTVRPRVPSGSRTRFASPVLRIKPSVVFTYARVFKCLSDVSGRMCALVGVDRWEKCIKGESENSKQWELSQENG